MKKFDSANPEKPNEPIINEHDINDNDTDDHDTNENDTNGHDTNENDPNNNEMDHIPVIGWWNWYFLFKLLFSLPKVLAILSPMLSRWSLWLIVCSNNKCKYFIRLKEVNNGITVAIVKQV